MRLCNGCKHFAGDGPTVVPQCRHALNYSLAFDYVNGKQARFIYATAQAVRMVSDLCGPDGKWHEERVEYRGRVERVCPACGAKHDGPFQACSACKTALDSGR